MNGLRDRVARDVYRIEVPLQMRSPDRLNCYLVRAGDSILLVDTGMRGSEDALFAGLSALDLHPTDVLITHGHPDHWGLASRFTDTVIAHRGVQRELDYARSPAEMAERFATSEIARAFGIDPSRFAVFDRYKELVAGIPSVREIEDGDVIGEWTVLWTPGHSPGHVCLYRAEDGVLIAGDHLLPGFTPNIQPDPDRPDALADYLGSLARVAALDVSLVLPAHGEPFLQAAERAEELVVHHRQRLERLSAYLVVPRTLEEVSAELFADLETGEDRMLASLEAYAHLEHLRLAGTAAVKAGTPVRWMSAPADDLMTARCTGYGSSTPHQGR